MSDGSMVYLKIVGKNEHDIATYLSSEALASDPRNHCVPILDHFEIDGPRPLYIIVMPFLRYIDDPDFDTVGSILDCVDQLLEVRLPFLLA